MSVAWPMLRGADRRTPTANDPRFDIALYSLPEAARLAAVPRRSLWNWMRGYEYPSGGQMVRAKAVIQATTRSETALSFVNLMEVRTLAGFRQTGVSMQRVRRALEYVRSEMQESHPLASKRILTDGVDLFWKYQMRALDGEVHLVNVSRGGQKAFPEAVMRYLREMEWGRDRLVTRWWPGAPAPGEGLVLVDPRRAFGAPVIARTGIRTEDIFQRFSAGEPLADLAEDYGLNRDQIEAAIRAEARFLEQAAA